MVCALVSLKTSLVLIAEPMYATVIAFVAIAFLLARGAETADTCLAYDYCDSWSFWCIMNNAIVSASVFVSLATTRVQCVLTRHLIGTSERGVCHVMAGPATGVESCMRDNIGAALLVCMLTKVYVEVFSLIILVCRGAASVVWDCMRPREWFRAVYEIMKRD